MIVPNSDTAAFCYWMLNVSWQQLTPSRLSLITTVYNAAVAGTSVTAQEWKNFTQVTAWRYKYYTVWRDGAADYGAPPVGTCDFWFNSLGLRYNKTNFFGVVNTAGSITSIYDVLGSSRNASQLAAGQNPSLIALNDNLGYPGLIGCNLNNNEMLTLNNSNGLTNNVSGYTLFAVARGLSTGSNRYIVGFSTGTSAAVGRLVLGVNTTGQWFAVIRRLDADPTFSLSGGDSTTGLQIVCFTMNYSTSTGTLYVNGSQIAQSTTLSTTGNTSATNSLGSYFAGFNGAQTWGGVINHTLGFQTALSAANVLTLSDWLNSFSHVY